MVNATDKAIQEGILALNARAWGISFGLLAGGAIFLATNFLVIKGGPNVGQHLALLAVFFPGYSVSFVGSLIGLVYGFVCGWALGRVIGAIYNRLAVR